MRTPARRSFRSGPYDALIRALRTDPAVRGVQPLTGSVRVSFDGATLELSPHGPDRTEAMLSCLHSSQRGRGHARAAMTVVIAAAATARADVRLEARPYGDAGLDTAALRAFYARLGFVDAAGGTMLRTVRHRT